MAKIYDSIMSLIKPGRIASAASVLGETEQKVSAGVDIILPSLLAKALKKGDTPEIRRIVAQAGKLKMSRDYKQIWEGSGVFDGMNIGERMENQLLGTENPGFYSAVAARTGITKDNADRLTNWVAATIAAFFGEKVAGGKTYASVLEELGREKEDLLKDIPSNILTELGLGSAAAKGAAAPAAGAVKKRRWGWLLWLALIILLLLLFFWWRSCGCKKRTETTAVQTEQAASEPAAAVEEVSFTLPDGTRITGFRGGCEECVINFLNSDKFKNATEEELRKIWFEFDGIDFEHNSATEMRPESRRQLDNLIAIMKNYPDVKIKIGAFADKTGTEDVNNEISRMRAETVMNAFVAGGIDASRISTEGFGETFATVPVSASDAERAVDRDIALRFTR